MQERNQTVERTVPIGRRLIASLIVLCLLYFVMGGLATLLGWLEPQRYAVIGGVVGGLASVLGLLTFVRPALNKEDIKQLELDSLRSLAETTEQIQVLERARLSTQQEISSLAERKVQMEFLVRKASLSLFLQEQRRLYQERIGTAIRMNKELETSIDEIQSIDNKLKALGEEIEADPNVDLLKEIIESAQKRTRKTDIDFAEFPPLTKTMLLMTRDSVRLLQRLLGS